MSPLHLPDKLIAPAKWVGYPLFALLVFVLSLYQALPRKQIQERLENDATAILGATVEADDFGLTLFSGPGVSATTVLVKTRPLSPAEKPTRYTVEDLVLHFSLYQLLRGFADTSFSGRIASGSVSGKFRSVPDEGLLVVDASEIALAEIPGIALAIPLPVAGVVELKADITTPKNVIPQANGSVALTITDATVGDGKAKLTIPGGDPFLSQGVTIPKIALGKIAGKVVIDKGRAVFRDLRGHSKDLDVELDGYIELRDPLSLSLVHLYLKVKPADALLKREPALELMINGIAPLARRSDGYLGFSITGTPSSPFALPSKEVPAGVTVPPPVRNAPPVATAPVVTPPPVRTHIRGEARGGDTSTAVPFVPAPPSEAAGNPPPAQNLPAPIQLTPATAMPPAASRFRQYMDPTGSSTGTTTEEVPTPTRGGEATTETPIP
ncbi:MAG: type II secretion system protein GspN [Myxococcales bacterium]|nr:type II secretion system protein GspN [Myxococcales bacterium]